MKKKLPKGSFGYLDQQRKYTLIRTILFFAISLAVYLIGYITTGSNQNYLTIVAVVGCLPACKSAVNTIMFFRYHGCSSKDHKKIAAHEQGLDVLYDLVFTSYEKNFEIHHMALMNDNLIGYTANPSCDAAACEKHLRTLLVQNSLNKINVKIFQDLGKYQNRLDQLASHTENDAAVSDDATQAAAVLSLMRAISL